MGNESPRCIDSNRGQRDSVARSKPTSKNYLLDSGSLPVAAERYFMLYVLSFGHAVRT